MGEDSILELLEIYMEMVERQDEIIYRLGKILHRQTLDLKLLQNDEKYSDDRYAEEKAIVDEVMDQYKEVKKGLDEYQP